MRAVWFLLLLGCRAPEPENRELPVPTPSLPVATDANIKTRFEIVPCAPTVLGRPFRGAVVLCIAFQAASITSLAIDEPARRNDARIALEALGDAALSPEARRGFPRNSVLYRGLVALVFAGLERISPNNARTPLFDELATELANDLRRGWLPSYEGEAYPCDHAPALSALRLHSILRGSRPDAADRLAVRLDRALGRGFPTSTTDRTERATTLAFTVAFLLPGEPDLARRFALQFVTFCERGVLTACREWRRPHAADAASGPIVGGYSVAATALGLPATRQLPEWHSALSLTAIAGASALGEQHPLESSLLRYGETARAWR